MSLISIYLGNWTAGIEHSGNVSFFIIPIMIAENNIDSRVPLLRSPFAFYIMIFAQVQLQKVTCYFRHSTLFLTLTSPNIRVYSQASIKTTPDQRHLPHISIKSGISFIDGQETIPIVSLWKETLLSKQWGEVFFQWTDHRAMSISCYFRILRWSIKTTRKLPSYSILCWVTLDDNNTW